MKKKKHAEKDNEIRHLVTEEYEEACVFHNYDDCPVNKDFSEKIKKEIKKMIKDGYFDK